jgi:hypothetical protein
MIHLTKTNKYMIGGAALLVVGYFGYSYWQKSKSSGPGPHQVQPPNSGSAYVNASFTSNGAMSTLDVQKALNDLGAQPPLVEDGVNGPNTTAAVRSFQQRMGIQVDGIVGPQTVTSLKMALSALNGGSLANQVRLSAAKGPLLA